MPDNQVRTLVIRFNNPLNQNELPFFRGAVIQAVGDENALLFHNHEGEGFRYSYPLIQYKRIGGKAALVCIGEGTEEIGKFFSSCNFDVQIGNRSTLLEVESVKPDKVLVQVWDDWFTYRIRRWLPLNRENYEAFQQLESLAEKYALLERLLVGNMLSFGKGVGVQFGKPIVCRITDMLGQQLITYKNVKMMAFDVEFKSNVSLPDFVGLGKGVSLGLGTVVKWEKK